MEFIIQELNILTKKNRRKILEITVDIDNELENFNEHINVEKIENYIKDVLKKEYPKCSDLSFLASNE